MLSCVHVQEWGRAGHLASSLVEGRSQHLSRLIQLKLQTISNIWSWNVADCLLPPPDLTIFPSTSYPSSEMLPACLMGFSATSWQSTLSLTFSGETVMWSLWKLPWKTLLTCSSLKVAFWISPLVSLL